jgi:hypothetical protein
MSAAITFTGKAITFTGKAITFTGKAITFKGEAITFPASAKAPFTLSANSHKHIFVVFKITLLYTFFQEK